MKTLLLIFTLALPLAGFATTSGEVSIEDCTAGVDRLDRGSDRGVAATPVDASVVPVVTD